MGHVSLSSVTCSVRMALLKMMKAVTFVNVAKLLQNVVQMINVLNLVRQTVKRTVIKVDVA